MLEVSGTKSRLVKALATKTPQPTPASLSRAQISEAGVGTPQRISTLRRDCLLRDRHRCVVTRKFDIRAAEDRLAKDGTDPKDDDGGSLLPESDTMAFLEVAHIIPHSFMPLTSIDGEPKLVCNHPDSRILSITYNLYSLSTNKRPIRS